MEHTNPASGEDNGGNGTDTFAARAEEKVRELRATARTEASHRVHDIGERAQHRLDAERDRVASRLEDAATQVRQRGDAAGSIGHTAGEQVATRIEAAAGYLHQRHTDEIAGDFSAYVKQHPVKAVIAAAVLGYFFGRIAG